MPIRFYRYVQSKIATTNDFLPQGAMGRVMRRPGNERTTRAWNEGVSVFDDFDYACQNAKLINFRPGSYTLELSLPTDHGFEIERTGKDSHHYTIYATPEDLLAYASGEPVRIPGAPDD